MLIQFSRFVSPFFLYTIIKCPFLATKMEKKTAFWVWRDFLISGFMPFVSFRGKGEEARVSCLMHSTGMSSMFEMLSWLFL